MHMDFNYNWPPYSWIYKVYTTTTQRLPVVLYPCASRCASVRLWRHGNSLRVSSVWMWPLFENCIMLQIIRYQDIPQWNWKQNSGLKFTIPFTMSFWLSFSYTAKFYNSPGPFSKLNHSLPIAYVTRNCSKLRKIHSGQGHTSLPTDFSSEFKLV